MSTFLAMTNKIEDDLDRTDLTAQVQREINRAIRKYSRETFWFSATRANFTTADGQQYYDSADGLPSDIRIVDYVRINQSTGTITTTTGTADAYELSPATAPTTYSDGDAYYIKISITNTGASTINISSLGVVDITRPNGVATQAGDLTANQVYTIKYNSTAGDFFLMGAGGNYYDVDERAIDRVVRWNSNDNPGLPLSYAWFEEKLYFWPIPDQTYLVDIFYEKYFADLSSDSDTNSFTTEPVAEQLIENEAKYHLYSEVILDDERAAVCKEDAKIALNTLRETTSNLLGVSGNIRPTTF